MLPGDYKRRYRFKTDPTKERRLGNWLIFGCFVLVFILWYFTKN